VYGSGIVVSPKLSPLVSTKHDNPTVGGGGRDCKKLKILLSFALSRFKMIFFHRCEDLPLRELALPPLGGDIDSLVQELPFFSHKAFSVTDKAQF
jgi:hypothetical protein